ncbi:hypothetical protein EUTSA_v10019785mg [Eutrema salsugineum]|uniref:Amino acid transporter transmembrane domain-containing protein n=1 Tax=Eutrema salsugineum TaxID=72664 RepID=V4KAK0_EUTSA|nr:hypothetical protein EUTSA_v10019785mg [Eutrema salsugineum]
MTIEDVTPIPKRSSSSSDDVTAQLFPKSHGDVVTYDEFNGASFSGAVFNLATTIIDLRFSKIKKIRSYGGLMGNSFGRRGKILLQVSVLVNNIGVLIVYMIIISSSL